MDLRATFAGNIKRLRKERGMSQEDLAFESGLHRTYISGIERGIRNVGLDNIGVIATALKVTPDGVALTRRSPSASVCSHAAGPNPRHRTTAGLI